VLAWDSAYPRRPVVDDGQLLVGGPREQLVGRVQRWLAAEALRLCGEDLAHYCARAGVPVPALGLSSARRRWGSCAADGSIRINWRLIMAPDACAAPWWRTRWRIWSISTTARRSTRCWGSFSKAAWRRPTAGSSRRARALPAVRLTGRTCLARDSFAFRPRHPYLKRDERLFRNVSRAARCWISGRSWVRPANSARAR
jgi:hypothetical protein